MEALGHSVVFISFLIGSQVSDRKVKKAKEMDHLNQQVSSENSLLAEQSFTADPNNMTISNGYHLEWINEKPDSASPSFRENRNTVCCQGST